MLPARHRLRRSADFSSSIRGSRRGGPGRRASTSLLVVHATPRRLHPREPARVGFIVSKAVGGAVVRNRTKRVLRHLVRDRLPVIPAGSDLVVRANPSAATATTGELARDLDLALHTCLKRPPNSQHSVLG